MTEMTSLNTPRVKAILDRYFIDPDTVKCVEYHGADGFVVHTWTAGQGKLMYGEGCNHCETPSHGCPIHGDSHG